MIRYSTVSSLSSSSSDLQNSNINESEGVDIVNSILCELNVPIRIKSLNECVSSLWILLYEGIFKVRLEETIRSENAVYVEAKIMNLQIILNKLRKNYGIPFSSKMAYELYSGNRACIMKLIYIFKFIYDHTKQNSDSDDIHQELQDLLQTLFNEDNYSDYFSNYSSELSHQSSSPSPSPSPSSHHHHHYHHETNNKNQKSKISHSKNKLSKITENKKIQSKEVEKNSLPINMNKRLQNDRKDDVDMKPIKYNSINDIFKMNDNDNDYSVYKDDYDYYYFENNEVGKSRTTNNENKPIAHNEDNNNSNNNINNNNFNNNYNNYNNNNSNNNNNNNDDDENDFDNNNENENDHDNNDNNDNNKNKENVYDHVSLEDTHLTYLLNNNNYLLKPKLSNVNVVKKQQLPPRPPPSEDAKSVSTQKTSKTNRTRSGTNKFIKLNDDIYNYIIINKIDDRQKGMENTLTNRVDDYTEKLKMEYQQKSGKKKKTSKNSLKKGSKESISNSKKRNSTQKAGKKKKLENANRNNQGKSIQPTSTSTSTTHRYYGSRSKSLSEKKKTKFQLGLEQLDNKQIKKNHEEIQLLEKEFSGLQSKYESLNDTLRSLPSKNPNALMETHRMEAYLENFKSYVTKVVDEDQWIEKLRQCPYFHYIGIEHMESIIDYSMIPIMNERIKAKKELLQKLISEDPNLLNNLKNEYYIEDEGESESEGRNEEKDGKLKLNKKKKLTEVEFQRKITNSLFEKRRKTVTINNLQKEINQIITDKQNILEFNKSLEKQRKLKAYKEKYRNLIIERNALIKEAKKKQEDEILLRQENMINFYKSQIDMYHQEAEKLTKDKQLIQKSYKEEIRKIRKDYYQQCKKDISLLRQKTKVPSDQFIF